MYVSVDNCKFIPTDTASGARGPTLRCAASKKQEESRQTNDGLRPPQKLSAHFAS
jgi:hypothetical protein